MNELKKLAAEMRAQAEIDTFYQRLHRAEELIDWADTLDAYLKAQESAVPVCPYLQPRSGTHVCILSGASPPPREPITRERAGESYQGRGIRHVR